MPVPRCSILLRHIPYVGVDWEVVKMTRALNKLSAAQVKNFGPGKYSDGGGLWLHKREDGGAQWFLRVTVHSRRREMGLGSLRDVSLREVRETAAEWRTVARQGKDPIKERERQKREMAKADHTLAVIAEEAFEARKAQLKGDGKAGRWFSPLELHVLPKLGRIPVEEIDQQDIKNTLAPIWHTKADTARKAMNRLGIVLRHAAAMGLDVDMQATEKAKALLGKSRHQPKHVLDLSRFDAAPLIAFIAAKETSYGTETDGRIPQGCGADSTDQWADAQAGG
jgi:Arm DNA-binding domain/Phage integrase central domain